MLVIPSQLCRPDSRNHMNEGPQPGFKELRALWAPRIGEGLAVVLSTLLFSSSAPSPMLWEHWSELKFTWLRLICVSIKKYSTDIAFLLKTG